MTLNKHFKYMRSPAIYAETNVWTDAEAAVAEKLLRELAEQPTLTNEDLLRSVSAMPGEPFASTRVERVWDRLQMFPHCFAVAQARGDLDSYNLHGVPISAEARAMGTQRAFLTTVGPCAGTSSTTMRRWAIST